MSAPSSRLIALCRAVALAGAADGAPEWIQLLPAGRKVEGADGRSWTLRDPARLISVFNQAARPLVLDWNHETELGCPERGGHDGAAAAWIKALELRAGELWGQVDWTANGRVDVNAQNFKWISPAFLRDEQGEILQLTSAALTNNPNFTQMAALNASGAGAHDMEKIDPQILTALGLGNGAGLPEVLAAIEKLKTDLNSKVAANVDLASYVPRADFNSTVERLTAVSTALKTVQADILAKDIETELNAAQSAGKITPASRALYAELCKRDDGLKQFRALCATLPVIAPPTNLDSRPAPTPRAGVGADGLTAMEREVCAQLRLDPKKFLETNAAPATA